MSRAIPTGLVLVLFLAVISGGTVAAQSMSGLYTLNPAGSGIGLAMSNGATLAL